jgi:hypothetical protein
MALKKKKVTQLDRIELELKQQKKNTAIAKTSPSFDTEQLNRIEGMVNKQGEAIDGNGHEGLKSRQARTEENIEAILKNQEINTKAISELTKAANTLKEAVDSHCALPHMNSFLWKPRTYIILAIAFMSLHFISTYIPNLWNIIMTGLGAPWLKLPLM